MSITRRDFLVTSASAAGFVATSRLGFGQTAPAAPTVTTVAPSATPPTPATPAAFTPKTPATADFLKLIGPTQAAELLTRLQKTNSDIKLKGLKTIRGVANAGGNFLTGYPYTEFYDWDLYFENLYNGYYGVYPYCYTNLKEFLSRQQADGYINRSLNKQRDRQHFKPFMAQLVVLGARQSNNDYAWLNTEPTGPNVTVPANGSYYNRLKKYVDKWFSYDGDGNGLPTWNSCDAAGNDNQWSRGGQLGAFIDEGVDLASYLVRELRAMAVIADHLGQKDDSKAFTTHADLVCKLINDVFWDEKDGMYYDRNEKTKETIRVKSVTNFMPLFCGAATPERAARTINERLLNEKEFWLAYPVASYAKTEPDYYQGSHNECNWRGSTWAPTNYMIFQGLMRYGHKDVAKELATRLFNMAVVKNPGLCEYYNAEDGSGLGHTQFWGFTSLYYVMLLEWHLDYDISDLEKPFRPIIPDELGVKFDV
jgi:hypothetical protein